MEELRRSIVLKVLLTVLSGIVLMVVSSYLMFLCNFNILSVNGILSLIVVSTLPQLWISLRKYQIPTLYISLGMIVISFVLSMVYAGVIGNSVSQFNGQVSMFQTVMFYLMEVHLVVLAVTLIINFILVKRK
ncbi:MAG: hypothetical protein MR283_07030 [Erysipelotrichaceae bacterium]|nr:hypothetical protein [Erysipelotrichaceae bacterium]MDY6034279.1 hypothetical protein [Bulleidia sp.]